jgi:hypothetical protein
VALAKFSIILKKKVVYVDGFENTSCFFLLYRQYRGPRSVSYRKNVPSPVRTGLHGGSDQRGEMRAGHLSQLPDVQRIERYPPFKPKHSSTVKNWTTYTSV